MGVCVVCSWWGVLWGLFYFGHVIGGFLWVLIFLSWAASAS